MPDWGLLFFLFSSFAKDDHISSFHRRSESQCPPPPSTLLVPVANSHRIFAGADSSFFYFLAEVLTLDPLPSSPSSFAPG